VFAKAEKMSLYFLVERIGLHFEVRFATSTMHWLVIHAENCISSEPLTQIFKGEAGKRRLKIPSAN
jgi:hypothetical protein